MITVLKLREYILDAADELNLPLTLRQVDRLTNRVAVRAARGKAPSLPFTDKNFAILTGIAAGEEAEETARRLGVTLNTVKSHRARVYKALGARNGAHAVAIAISLGLLQAPSREAVAGGDA